MATWNWLGATCILGFTTALVQLACSSDSDPTATNGTDAGGGLDGTVAPPPAPSGDAGPTQDSGDNNDDGAVTCLTLEPGSSFVTEVLVDGGPTSPSGGGTLQDGTYVLTERSIPNGTPTDIAGQLQIATSGTERSYVRAVIKQGSSAVVESGVLEVLAATGEIRFVQECPAASPGMSNSFRTKYNATGSKLEVLWSDSSFVGEVWTRQD